jgi:protein disulfide-isomerase
MKRNLTLLLLGFVMTWNVSGAEWLTDLPTALARARKENKTVLIDFTGSDWCGWCKRLKAEVFDKPQFEAFANANLILVEADFPRGKKLPPALKEANQALLTRYQVDGFPTIVLLDDDQKFLGKTGYVQGGPKAFIAELEKMPTVKRREPVAEPAGKDPFAAPNREVTGPPAKINYSEIALKAISGKPNKRLALINNQSFAQGETAMVKLDDKKLKVFCKEIRENSVVVQIDGKPEIELLLGKTPAPVKAGAK